MQDDAAEGAHDDDWGGGWSWYLVWVGVALAVLGVLAALVQMLVRASAPDLDADYLASTGYRWDYALGPVALPAILAGVAFILAGAALDRMCCGCWWDDDGDEAES